ncbi:hypothetical protein F2P81_004221 [Scophthalmus maximus]|uniref:Uncharacterized protein n=1 Tax=Scophthalmus maximus TaxID=52904 RepID=A0A6A4TI13_SCOMX|nr:hypothetical protein F2P81_004221 [Scophthalmus maximus]
MGNRQRFFEWASERASDSGQPCSVDDTKQDLKNRLSRTADRAQAESKPTTWQTNDTYEADPTKTLCRRYNQTLTLSY